MGWVQIFPLVVGWVGLGQSADGLGWIGSHRMDPWTTLVEGGRRRAAGKVTAGWRGGLSVRVVRWLDAGSDVEAKNRRLGTAGTASATPGQLTNTRARAGTWGNVTPRYQWRSVGVGKGPEFQAKSSRKIIFPLQ